MKIGDTWEKAIKFWPAIVFLAGAYVGFAKLQWQSTSFDKRIEKIEEQIKQDHEKLIRWEGRRDRERGR